MIANPPTQMRVTSFDSIEGSKPVDAWLPFHAERDQLFNELHARPFPLLEQGTRVSQFALLHGGKEAEAEYRHIQLLCERYSILPPVVGSSCYYQSFGGFELHWERHTEFSTYTFFYRLEHGDPFSHTALSLLPPSWLAALPGKVISGLHVEVMGMPDEEATSEKLRPIFEGHGLISSWVTSKRARLWTAYRIHRDGFGRILVHDKGLTPGQTGRLMRRLLEIETYRMMVLLAFPIARQIAPGIAEMDQQLVAINEQINTIQGLDDERRLLEQLSLLAARIEHLRSDTNFRFSAARAYYELVLSRLEELREQEEPGMQTFGEFLPRRLTPAYRTCEAVSGQLENLSKRIDRASELLRTRIDVMMESQNRDLLESMNSRGQAQLQLQQAVEGLSVVAISYYMVGLVKYVAGSLQDMGVLHHPELVVGLSVPVCVLLVWTGVRRLRRKWVG